MNVYSTRHALTRGIEVIDITGVVSGDKSMHETYDAALRRANIIRRDKIADLRKYIAKLEAIEFKTEE